MELKDVLSTAIEPALLLLPARMTSDQARVMLLAIGLQESRFKYRQQIGGPARGFWQFEAGGGIRGVINHAVTRPLVRDACDELDMPCCVSKVYEALPLNDVLAAVFARLLLFSDPAKLPAIGDVQGAWNLYLRTWRPGKPHRQTWDALYAQAVEAVACST